MNELLQRLKAPSGPQHPGRSPCGSARILLLAICGLVLFPVASFATPRDEIVQAVAANTARHISEAQPKQFLKAFTVVALRAQPRDLPAYVIAAINLRQDLTPKVVTVAVKAAVKNCEDRPQIVGAIVQAIVRAAIAASPDAALSIARASASASSDLRLLLVSAAIEAAPEEKDAIIEAASPKTVPFAFLAFSVSGVSGFSFHADTLSPANIQEPTGGIVTSPEQPPSH